MAMSGGNSRSRIAQQSQIGFGLRTPFAYLIVQIQNGPGLEGDPFLRGPVCSKIIAQEKVLSPLSPFRPGKIPPTVFPVSWVVKLSGCAACPSGEHLIASTTVFIDEPLSITLCVGLMLQTGSPTLHVCS